MLCTVSSALRRAIASKPLVMGQFWLAAKCYAFGHGAVATTKRLTCERQIPLIVWGRHILKMDCCP